MLYLVIGFFLGLLAMFLVCGTILIIRDERDVKAQRMHKSKKED